jgi:hypothetical protein
MKILVIPDTQCKPGIDFTYLNHIGQYIVEKEPDVIVHLGDHWDFPSLSSYDKGKKSMELRRYKADVEAGNTAMDILLKPLKDYNEQQVRNKKKQYNPRKVFLFGNHCERVMRAVNDNPQLEGAIGFHDLNLKDWETHKFLEVVVIEGVAFSHYFTSGVKGLPITSAAVLLSKGHMSCVAGHQQGRQTAHAKRLDGKLLTAIICGSCYEHNEDYLGPQGNEHYRGILMLHEVKDGRFDEMYVSLDFLRKKYHG